MRNPYKKDKGPGRLGGNPLENVVGEAAGVQGQKVQPGKGATMSGKTATVKVGQSSSFNTSTGLVNALDVVQGISQTMAGVDRLGNQIDDARLTEMKKKIATMQSADEWTNPEAPGYLNDEAKLKSIQDIQNEYKGGWLNDRYRAQYEGEVANNRIAAQNLDFNGDLAWAQRSREQQIAMGVPIADAQANTDRLYESILKKHGKDTARAEQIKSAQLGDAALWAQSVSASAQHTIEAWESSGGLERLNMELPPSVGYEEWEQTALASMASYSGEGGAALWESYNQQSGKFEGPYADMLSQTLRRTLEPTYNKAVAMEVADQDLKQKTAITQSPRIASVDWVSATDPEVGFTRVADGFAGMRAMINNGQRPMTYGQRQPILGDYLGKVSVGAFQLDATMTTDEAAEMMNAVAVTDYEGVAAFVGMDPDSEEFSKYLEDQIKVGMSTFRAAKQQRQNEQDKAAKFQLEKHGPTTDSTEARKRITADPFVAASKGGDSPRLSLIDANTGGKFDPSDPKAQAFGMMGTDFITQATWQKGPEARAQMIDKWVTAYQEYINNPDLGHDHLALILSTAAEDTPWQVNVDQNNGGISFSLDNVGDPEAVSNAQIGAMLPYLALDEDGFYKPTGQHSSIVAETMSSMVRSKAYTSDNRVSEEFLDEAVHAGAVARSIFPAASAYRVTSDAVLKAVQNELGASYEMPDDLRIMLSRAFQDGDQTRIGQLLESAVVQRGSIPLEYDKKTQMVETWGPGVSTLFGAALSIQPGTSQAQSGARNTLLNPLDWSIFGGDYSGIDVDVANQRIDSVGDKVGAQRITSAAEAAKVIQYNDLTQQWMLRDPEVTTQMALDISNQLGLDGYAAEPIRNEDGDVVRTEIISLPSLYSGDGLRNTKPAAPFTGDFTDAMQEGMMGLDDFNEEYSRTTIGSIAGGTWDWMFNHREGSTGDVFYEQQVQAIHDAGESTEAAHQWLADSNNRRHLADHSAPFRGFVTGQATKDERLAFGNQIDETITTFKKAGVPIDEEDAQAVRDVAEQIRAGTLPPDHDLWKKTQEIAKAQGFTMWDTNPPKWAAKLALMTMLFPDNDAVIQHLSPYDLDVDSTFRADVDPANLRETQLGYDTQTRYTLDNLKFIGRTVENISGLPIPLFGPTMVEDRTKGDPRTFVRGKKRTGNVGTLIGGHATLSGKPVKVDNQNTIIHDAARFLGAID